MKRLLMVMLAVASCKPSSAGQPPAAPPVPTPPAQAPAASTAPTAPTADEATDEDKAERTLRLVLGKKIADQAIAYADKASGVGAFRRDMTRSATSVLVASGVPFDELDVYLGAAGDLAKPTRDRDRMIVLAAEILGHARRRGYMSVGDLARLDFGFDDLRQLDEFAKMPAAKLSAFLASDESIPVKSAIRLVALRGPDSKSVGDVMAARDGK